MKNNAYFEQMERAQKEWSDQQDALKKKKTQIIETYGWDSEELKAWYEEAAKNTIPYSQGAWKAYRAFRNSEERGSSELEMEDFLWDREVGEFVETLRSAGISTFAYTNQSTALMENIHDLAKAGCRIEGLCTVIRRERRFGEDQDTEYPGIRFSL